MSHVGSPRSRAGLTCVDRRRLTPSWSIRSSRGLAISLLFGLVRSTLLTVLVIPAIYVFVSNAQEEDTYDAAATT